MFLHYVILIIIIINPKILSAAGLARNRKKAETGMKQMKKRLLMELALLFMTGLCIYIGRENAADTIRGQAAAKIITTAEESPDEKLPSVRNMESAKTEQTASEASESTEAKTDELQTPTWQIAEKYAAEPMNPLVHDKADPWYSYEEAMYPDIPDAITFMSSRDGQGFHPWIYRKAADIMYDYGKRIGYDFMSDHWMVEHIWPIEGGYYNILLSQENHDVILDLLCQPENRKYVIVYARYENGDRGAGYNDAVSFDSQLEWTDFDYNAHYETPGPSVTNPFRDLYETSVYQPCYFALHQYMLDTGYDGEWHIRQIFGRAPFWDFLAESESGFVWVCSDLDYFTYVPIPKPDTAEQ